MVDTNPAVERAPVNQNPTLPEKRDIVARETASMMASDRLHQFSQEQAPGMQGALARSMREDPRYLYLEEMSSLLWQKTHSTRGKDSPEWQKYLNGDPQDPDAPTLKKDTEKKFREQFGYDAEEYDAKALIAEREAQRKKAAKEKAELDRIYQNPNEDPAVLELTRLLSSEVERRRGEITDYDSLVRVHREVEMQTAAGFIQKYQKKAEVYSGNPRWKFSELIKKALENRKKAQGVNNTGFRQVAREASEIANTEMRKQAAEQMKAKGREAYLHDTEWDPRTGLIRVDSSKLDWDQAFQDAKTQVVDRRRAASQAKNASVAKTPPVSSAVTPEPAAPPAPEPTPPAAPPAPTTPGTTTQPTP